MTSTLRIVEAGWATTFQDRGRPGVAHLGVPGSGAVDRAAHDLVNRLVGNGPEAATLETLGGLVIEALRAVVVATSSDGVLRTMRPGERVRVDAPTGAVWAYLAVRGGLAVDPVLGSRSTDTLSGLGPPAPSNGAELAIGDDPRTELPTDLAPRRLVDPGERPIVVWAGPQTDHFGSGLAALTDRAWTISAEVSRVGSRLVPAPFERVTLADGLPSAGLVTGAVQVTPDDQPIVMLADHPTTGGYPVIAVVDPLDLGRLAQARAGTVVRFVAGSSMPRRRGRD